MQMQWYASPSNVPWPCGAGISWHTVPPGHEAPAQPSSSMQQSSAVQLLAMPPSATAQASPTIAGLLTIPSPQSLKLGGQNASLTRIHASEALGIWVLLTNP